MNASNETPKVPSTTPAPAAPRGGGPGKPAELSAELSAEINAELDAAMKELDAAKAPAAPAAAAAKPRGIRGPRVVNAGRVHRTGKVVSVGPTDIFLEFSPRELGVVPRTQFTDDQLPVVGAELEVVVDKHEAAENLFVCSRPGSVQKAEWELLEIGQVIEARVTGVVTGKEGKPAGLELEVAGHRAFMPAGQISFDRVPDLSVYVGEKLKAAVSRIERGGKGNIVLSRRDILEQERKEKAEALKKTLSEGQTIEGVVRKIMPFGAFVDLGGLDGLIHISDLTYDRVGFGEKAVEKHVKEGQKVTVRILKLDFENNRISLGLKQLAGDPFANAGEAVVEGAEVNGRVTKIMEFGCFVEVAPGVEGLVHISELDYKRVNRVDDVVKPDEIVRCKVIKLDKEQRRISLSIKALKPAPEPVPGKENAGRKREGGRSAEEIQKETPALRRMRERFKNFQFKGGLS